jgi:hypothetical protein
MPCCIITASISHATITTYYANPCNIKVVPLRKQVLFLYQELAGPVGKERETVG